MSFDYLEHCIAVANTIDVDALSALPLGPPVEMGSRFSFHSLGELSLAGEEKAYVGLKLPVRSTGDIRLRLRNDIVQTHMALVGAPALKAYLPDFIALMQLEGDEHPSGILTPDYSEGGAKIVRQVNISTEAKDLLYEAFRSLGPREQVLEEDSFGSIAFKIDGEERLLDLTPSPIKKVPLYSMPAAVDVLMNTVNSYSSLTVTIPRSSRFGQDLQKLQRRS